jgi:5-methylcytosine-specific restriction endonuclease McrA
VPWPEWTAHKRKHRRNGSTRAWRTKRAAAIARDGGRCTHVDDDGGRCFETEGLEAHHIDGDWRNDAPENLATRCGRHNPREPLWWARDMVEGVDAPQEALQGPQTRRSSGGRLA